MKKNGFTLIELLGVLIILTFLTFIVSEIIINNLNDTNSKLEKQLDDILISSAREYVNKNTEEFNKDTNKTYCLDYASLEKKGYIYKELLPSIKIDNLSDLAVKIKYNGNLFEYEVINNCEYIVTYNLKNVEIDKAVDAIRIDKTEEFTFTPISGYCLPNAVTVKGAKYTWNQNVLTISNVYGDIIINVEATKCD